MMHNRIDRFRFRLRASFRDAECVQRRCSLLFHDALRAHIARVIEQCDDGSLNELCQLDRLVIHVGDIAQARLEVELLERVLVELARVLQAALNARSSEGGNSARLPMETAAYRYATRSAMLRPTAMADTSPSGWSSLLRYLDTGVWRVPDSASSGSSGGPLPSPHAYMMRLMQTSQAGLCDDSSGTRLALAKRCLQPNSCHRLIAGCDNAALRSLFAWWITPTRIDLPSQPDWSLLLPLGALLALQRHPVATQVKVSQRYTSACIASTSRPLPFSGYQATPVTAIDAAQRHSVVPQRSVSAACLSHDASRAALSSDHSFQACLDALLARPLTKPMRRMLRDLLMSRFDDTNPAPWLTTLTARLRERLVVALDLRNVRPTLQATASMSRASSLAGHAPRERDALAAERAMWAKQALASPQRRSNPLVEAEPLVAANAGLVLLWPVLPRLFQTFELVDADNRWQPDAARRAVALLDWLAAGQTPPADWRLPVPRLLCGLSPLPDNVQPTDWPVLDEPQQVYADSWLNTTLAVLPGLQRLSVTDMRAFFLQRTGMLTADTRRLTLAVERDAIDVLLSQVPWPLTQIALPWLPSPIEVEWFA
ncbi:contractile injection system tape measure protein [Mycetohabitans rhizoxinica]|uniref:contractile injection system tape measure protein n=1 Tax=Mycetohabitans rhizoxinica TaxID=412963 RepID=UPI0030CEA996